MGEMKWKMEHVLELTPSWMRDGTNPADQAMLQAKALGALSGIIQDSGCVVTSFEVLPETSLDAHGKLVHNEFRMRIALHAEPRGRFGVDFERIGSRICRDFDGLPNYATG